MLGLIAIPLAPLLYEDHFLVLVLARPTKEVLLAGGFLARRGEVELLQVVIAAVPLSILAVWHFFYLGRAYQHEIAQAEMPGAAERILTPRRIKRLERALHRRGTRLVFLGRLAALSSATVGAAAGAAQMRPRRFCWVDGAGAVVSLTLSVGAGYLLERAYQVAGPWLTGLGAAMLATFAIVLGRTLQRG